MREVEALKKAIVERSEQIAKMETTLEEAKQRFVNQEKLVTEVCLFLLFFADKNEDLEATGV